ncbi:MAG: metal-sensitive transcriptional regulator [Candidatus Pacebacteria bacterium]|nr:metal-sensitive transcriptional regulator [Candidatus Paceibacterota bacterium]
MSNKQLQNRLSRLDGQLKKLQENINNNEDCSDVIPQFLAVKGAVAGSFEEYVKLSLDSCAKSDEKKMTKLINLLVRA